jgi:hypothetical protein
VSYRTLTLIVASGTEKQLPAAVGSVFEDLGLGRVLRGCFLLGGCGALPIKTKSD